MRTYTNEITSEEYNNLMAMDRKDAEWAYCGATIICGYGLYGFDLFEKDGKYFVTITMGNSCD